MVKYFFKTKNEESISDALMRYSSSDDLISEEEWRNADKNDFDKECKYYKLEERQGKITIEEISFEKRKRASNKILRPKRDFLAALKKVK